MTSVGDRRPRIKCVVWDLDNTLWDGVLLEAPEVWPRSGAADAIRLLDARGVLQSIASKNDPERALARLDELDLTEYFLYPQISWGPKSEAVTRIAAELNIGIDTVLFVDDDPFERAEVATQLPAVRCVDAAELTGVTAHPDLPGPDEVTAEAGRRRTLYRREARRREHESGFAGTKAEFLESLGLRLEMRDAGPADLHRVAELTERTNQLNTTGVVYGHEELVALAADPDHHVLVLSLEDTFGDYGQIGVIVARREPAAGELRLLLFLLSCRVMGRNLVPPIVARLASAADHQGLALTADFRPTDVNRNMYLAYRFAGFTVEGEEAAVKRLRLPAQAGREVPRYVEIVTSGAVFGVGESVGTGP